jgi:CcmD family protein
MQAKEEPTQRSTEFRAVEGGNEMVSGGTLLVEAYAALWLILLGFLLVSWRRQARIDARVDELEKTLARGGAK